MAIGKLLPASDLERSTDTKARLGYPQVKKEIEFTLSADWSTRAAGVVHREVGSRLSTAGSLAIEMADE